MTDDAPHEVRRTIPRFKRSDLIVEEVRRWIVAEGLRAGDRLPKERELIELLDCSRGTVREALKVLESQGLIEILPGAKGGARIASVSYERTSRFLRSYLYFQPLTWAQVYRVREKLEPILAVSVVGKLSEEDFAALRQTLEICRMGIVGEVEPQRHRAAELDFHAILCAACPDPLLRFVCTFITDLLRDLMEKKNVIEALDSDFAKAALKYHAALIDAFDKGDRGAVERLMSEHIHDAGCMVTEREARFENSFLLEGQP